MAIMSSGLYVLLSALGETVNPAVVPTDSSKSVLGLWHFDEGEGLKAKDSSGNNNNLTLQNTAWTDGKLGKCLVFDGKKSCAVIHRTSSSLFSKSEFTVSAWIKPAKLRTAMEIINAGANDRGPGYRLFMAWNMLFFRTGNGSTYWGVKIPSPFLLVTEYDNWHHVAVTFKNGKYRIYLDGVMKKEAEGQDVVSGGKIFTIGAYHGQHYFFKGLIDEVEILQRAKTEEEILRDARLVENDQ